MNLINVPIIYQCNNSACGIACVQSILGFYDNHIYQEELYNELKFDKNEGTYIDNIINFFNKNNYECYHKVDTNINTIKNLIKNGIPVLTVFQAWNNKKNINWRDEWNSGHYSIIIGIDDNNIYMMDPSIQGNYGYIPIKDFISRWHDYDNKKKYKQWICAIYYKKPHSYKKDVIVRIK